MPGRACGKGYSAPGREGATCAKPWGTGHWGSGGCRQGCRVGHGWRVEVLARGGPTRGLQGPREAGDVSTPRVGTCSTGQ